MKIPLPFLVSLIIGAVTAQAVPFIEVIDVVTRVAGGTRVVENGPTTGISGQVTQSAGAFDESTGFSREVAVADVGYLVDDISAFISAQVTTAGPPTQGESEIVITFTSSKPIIVESERLINQEQSDAFLNNTSLDPFRALPAGTHTIQLTADSSANNANLALNISISEDLDVDPPPPPPPPPPPAGPLKWKEYLNGQWQQAARWTPERAPVAADKVAFDVLPAAELRSAPLDFIDVTSAGTDAGSVATLDISVSAVRFLNFNLNISGAADEPDALTIRNGGVLRVDFPLPSTNASRISFDTARTSIGDGKKQALRRGQVLDNSRLEIGSAVVWRNTGLLSVGERMQGEVLIETRLEDQTASECTGDVLLGVRPGSNGTLIVTGRFIASGLLAGSRPRTVGVVGVTRGGILETNAAELGSGERASAGAIVNDGAVLEPNGLDNYSSEGERSTWRIDGTLSLSGVPGGAAGASRGLATLDAFDGGLVTALRADVGTGAPSIKTVAGRTARISATGFDSADLEPAEIRIDGSLTVGESCSARAEAKEAGLISAGAIRVRALGRLSSVGFIPAANDFAGQNSLITTSRENETGDVIVGALTIDGGGIVELKDGGDLTAGVLTLGGVTPKARLARLRHDSSAPEFPRGTLTMTRFILGDGISFPARFDLFDGIASIDEDSEITQGSILNGFGLIGAPSEVSIRNNGRVIVPPGAERVLEMRSSFRQGETGELILTVNKDNDASVAPLDVRGSALVLAGKVTLRFSGGRLPRPGEAYALIRAENAVIANLATFKVAGARGAFDIVEDDFGIVLVFK